MSNLKETHFNLGAQIGAILITGQRAHLRGMMAKEAKMQSSEGAPFQRELCKIAYAAFATAGEEHSPEAILFRNLSQEQEWHSAYNRFTDCVTRSLGKQATILPLLAGLHDKTGGGVMKTITAGGVLGGAALGSLAFLLSRNAQQSSAENSAMLEKIRAYKQLKRDIKEDMSNRRVMETKKDERYSV